jgi:NAD(P)-dependent dehydrogenase (short-subunit alcohol dehydrogenase family)
MAAALAGIGFDVGLCGRRAGTLAESAAAIESAGGVALPVVCDVGERAAVGRLLDTIVRWRGRVDILVNNAGMLGPNDPAANYPADAFEEVMATNVLGAFHCAQCAFRVMCDQSPQGGRIINIGSLSGKVPRPNAIGYTVSKHAVTGLTRALALEGRRHGIVCTQIDIGNAATDMTERFAQQALQADGTYAAEPRFDPIHAAGLVAFLARLPLDVNVPSVTMMASAMPYGGRG